MRYIKTLSEGLEIFKALGSDIRIEILSLLLENGKMSMNELAERLDITNGALTNHIRKLEAADLIRVNSDSACHGNQKLCEPHLDKLLFVLNQGTSSNNEHRSYLRAGQYSSYEVYPTCGISTAQSVIGSVDDARYFAHQKRFEADIIWFSRGYVEYQIPCIIPHHNKIDQISISAELSSEAPGSNEIWPSDIHFYLNNTFIGIWTSPGDFADTLGLFTPDWWFVNWNQYGLLKTLTINRNGVFMDNVRISNVSIDQFHLDYRDRIFFRMAVPDSAKHIGGLTVYGRGFGNYNQDIEFRVQYSPIEEPLEG